VSTVLSSKVKLIGRNFWLLQHLENSEVVQASVRTAGNCSEAADY